MTAESVYDYYDPCYGEISLPELAYELISSCPELKRLKDLGFTNFDTLSMHPLSKISRLEHAIGVAYLTSVFLDSSLFTWIERNNLLAAALMHDVGSAPFGHTVEWTLNRYVDFDHEKNVRRVLKGEEIRYDLQIAQMYYEPNLFHRRFISNKRAKERYHLDPDLILSYLQGEGKGRIIASSGIDFDNIDNVFRMNFYTGGPYQKDLPVKLVKSLSWRDEDFLISETNLSLIQDWLDARYRAYDLLIYNEEYVAYEYMLSRAVETYFKELVSDRHVRLEPSHWALTDDRLVQMMYEAESTKELGKRLRLLNFYDVIGMYVSEKLNIQPQLTNATERESIERSLEPYLQQYFAKSHPKTRFSVAFHCTTDFRKRYREISINVQQNDGRILPRTFSTDRDFLVIGVLTPWKLSTYPKEIKTDCRRAVLDFLRANLDPDIKLASERLVVERIGVE